MARPGELSRAKFASNWWMVLIVDASIGLVLAAAGIYVMVRHSTVAGAFAAASGLTYVVLVSRRARQWNAERREAGLSSIGRRRD